MKTVLLVIFLTLLLILNFSNIVHVSFTDEYDNLLGGALVNKGALLYKDFFSNHGPVAYYLAAGIEVFAKNDFFRFRVVFQYLIWMGEVLLIYYFFKTENIKRVIELSIFFAITAISANFFYGYLLVADNLAGIFLTAGYILLFYALFRGKILSTFTALVISFLSALALLTSFTYVFVVFLINIFLLLNYFSKTGNRSKKSIFKIGAIILAPYFIYGLYLFITNSWPDYYFQTITFNREYYVYGEAKQAQNIFHLAYLLLVKVVSKYKDLILSFNQFNLQFPFMPALLLSNTCLWLYLLLTKRIKLFFFTSLSIIYTNARNNPFSPGPLDFHSSPYIFISLFNGVFALFNVWHIAKTKINLLIKILFGSIAILLIVYLMSFFQFFYNRWRGIMQDKLVSKAPLYQIHPVSFYLNQLISPEDYYLIGPYDPMSNFYSYAKSASRYYYLMPAMDRVPTIKGELKSDINKHKPKIIIYHTEMNILGVEPGKDFIHDLRKDYINLEDLKTRTEIKYTPILKFIGEFRYDLERHFFIRREILNEILTKMDNLGYIQLLTFPEKILKRDLTRGG